MVGFFGRCIQSHGEHCARVCVHRHISNTGIQTHRQLACFARRVAGWAGIGEGLIAFSFSLFLPAKFLFLGQWYRYLCSGRYKIGRAMFQKVGC